MLIAEIIGNLGYDAVVKQINGKDYVSFDVAHEERNGNDKSTVWVSVLWYGNGGAPREACQGTEGGRRGHTPQPGERRDEAERANGLSGLPRDASDTYGMLSEHGMSESKKERYIKDGPTESSVSIPDWSCFPTQSPVCGRDDGISVRLDGITFPRWRAESIKAYGNAVVPQVVYEIFRAIEAAEKEA